MVYRQDLSGIFVDSIGAGGVSSAGMEEGLALMQPVFKNISQEIKNRASPLYKSIEDEGQLSLIKEESAILRGKFSHMVVIGAGASSLNPRLFTDYFAVQNVVFLENVDVSTVEKTLAPLDLSKTCILTTSKSGNTLETLALTSYVIAKMEQEQIVDLGSHFVFITIPNENSFHKIAKEINAKIIEHEEEISGRFAIFTAVGLLPVAFAGVEIDEIIDGAKEVIVSCETSCGSDPFLGAIFSTLFAEKKHNISVMMPYGDRFSGFASWYRQIWAESLGKNGKGITPIKAMGAQDQHSQLQLYLEGPHDKHFTLIHTLDAEEQKLGKTPKAIASIIPEFILHKTLEQMLVAACDATYQTLKRHERPVRRIILQGYSGKNIGALAMHFAMETIITARIQDVNPYDQPAVEEGKTIARNILSNI